MNKKWENEEIYKVINLLKQNKTYNEIGLILNRSKDSVRNKITKLGITYETFNPKPGLMCGINEKYCSTCKGKKSKESFNKNKKNKDGISSICRECSNTYSKKFYNENKKKHKNKVNERSKKIILFNKQKEYDYYKANPCDDCGNNNPIVLEFDHRDKTNKICEVSSMLNRSCSWSTIKKEIDKCDVRCANCHRIKTSIQQNWYSKLLM